MIDCFIVLLKPTCGRKSYNRTDYYGTLKNEKYCSSFYFFSSFWVQFVVNYTWSEKPHCKLIFYQCFCSCFTELFELNSLVNAIVLLILSMINMFFTFMSLLALAQSCGMLRPWNGATYHPLKNLTPKN